MNKPIPLHAAILILDLYINDPQSVEMAKAQQAFDALVDAAIMRGLIQRVIDSVLIALALGAFAAGVVGLAARGQP